MKDEVVESLYHSVTEKYFFIKACIYFLLITTVLEADREEVSSE